MKRVDVGPGEEAEAFGGRAAVGAAVVGVVALEEVAEVGAFAVEVEGARVCAGEGAEPVGEAGPSASPVSSGTWMT